MALYAYSDEHIEKMIARIRRVRVWFCITASAVVLAALFVFFYPYSPAFERYMPAWLESLLVTLFVVPLLQILWSWKTWADKASSSLRARSFDISPAAVTATYSSSLKRQLNRGEIVRAEEPSVGAGLYLRTANRYRWLLIPRRMDDYDAMKGELITLGIPIEKTSTPPNCEEYVFALLFVGTLLCTMFVHNVRVLTANVVVAALIALAGLYVVHANPDNRANPKMRMARFGAFIPVVFAIIGLVFAIYGGGL